ncbi:hypothetical protein [Enterovibrio calviensis]|nr:hypothetical protein [Enterovibrio calviensis]
MPLLLVGLGGLGLGSIFGVGISDGMKKTATVLALLIVGYLILKNKGAV